MNSYQKIAGIAGVQSVSGTSLSINNTSGQSAGLNQTTSIGTTASYMYNQGYQCRCGAWVGNYQVHNCYYPYANPFYGGYISLGTYSKPLSAYTLEELVTELKLRKTSQDAKVAELKKEVELQKQLNKMLEDVK